MDSAGVPAQGIVPGDGWAEVLQRCLAEPGVILALGGTDVGKTSLCRWLSYRLSEAGRVAVIDADLGQSRIGPPAAVGLRIMGQAGSRFCFAGDTSPARCPAATLAAFSRIARLAHEGSPGCLMVDTSGWVLGEAAEDLKLAKIELLRPRHILAIQRTGELEPILRAIPEATAVSVHRLAPSDRVSPRNARQRAQWRRERFAHFLERSGERRLSLAGRFVTHLPAPGNARAGQLVGLEDRYGLGICLGLLQEIDFGAGSVRLLCPPEGEAAIGVHFGNVWFDARWRGGG